MKLTTKLGVLAVVLGAMTSVQAKDVKIGVVLPMSGRFASHGKQLGNGIKLFMSEHGDTVAGDKIEIIIKDDTGISPEVANSQAQETLIKNQATILPGFRLTHNALRVAPPPTKPNAPNV